MSKKQTPLDQDILVSNLTDLVLKGYRSKDLNKYIEKEWGLSEAQRKRYIAKARDNFKQIDKKKCGQLRSRYRKRLEMMFHQAYNVDRDLETALKIQKQLNELIDIKDENVELPNIQVVFRNESNENE